MKTPKPYTIEENPALSTVNEVFIKYETSATNPFILTLEANKGVKVSAVSDLMVLTQHKKDYFADILNLSSKTLDRYMVEDKALAPSAGEQVLKLLSLYKKGNEVFGTIQSFNKWLDKPSIGLGNQLPHLFMHTSGGIDLIFEELLRIEFGDIA